MLAEILPRVLWVVEFLPESGRPQSHYCATSNGIDGKSGVWKILHDGVRFIKQGREVDSRKKKKRAQMLVRALRKLGHQVTITPITKLRSRLALTTGVALPPPHYKPIIYFYCRPLPYGKARSRSGEGGRGDHPSRQPFALHASAEIFSVPPLLHTQSDR